MSHAFNSFVNTFLSSVFSYPLCRRSKLSDTDDKRNLRKDEKQHCGELTRYHKHVYIDR